MVLDLNGYIIITAGESKAIMMLVRLEWLSQVHNYTLPP